MVFVTSQNNTNEVNIRKIKANFEKGSTKFRDGIVETAVDAIRQSLTSVLNMSGN